MSDLDSRHPQDVFRQPGRSDALITPPPSHISSADMRTSRRTTLPLSARLARLAGRSLLLLTMAALLACENGTTDIEPLAPAEQGGAPEDGTLLLGSKIGPTPTLPLPEFPDEAVDGDYDYDDDGLLEIRTLAQLDAMRLDLEGTGFVQEGRDQYFAAFPGTIGSSGCLNQTCAGYELAAHLDFDTNGNGEAGVGDDYWNDGAGWIPLPEIPEGVTFDGNGYTISNLYVTLDGRSEFDYIRGAGLFSTNRGQIRNVVLVSAHVEAINGPTEHSYSVMGALAALNEGTINASSASGAVSDSYNTDGDVGGLVGVNRGTVSGCEFSGDVLGKGTVGGLVGTNNKGSVSDSRADGAVTDGSSARRFFVPGRPHPSEISLGGLVGLNRDGTITNSAATSDVSGSAAGVGGLAGDMWNGTVSQSNASGSVSGIMSVGGLIGDMWSGSVSQSKANGSVSGMVNVGGLIGWSGSSDQRGREVSASEASGDVSGNANVGGLVGLAVSTSISSSAATGNVSGGENVGGLVGASGATIGNSSAAGEVTGALVIGGLVGFNGGTLSDSKAMGPVTGAEYVGGLVGFNIERGTIEDSESAGDVSGDLFRGQVAGVNDGGSVTGSEGLGTVSSNDEPISMAERDLLFPSGHHYTPGGGAGPVGAMPVATPQGATGEAATGLRMYTSYIPGIYDRQAYTGYSSFRGTALLNANGQLVLLHLYSVSGKIPPELGNSTNLTYLSLGGDLSGEIPPELGNLSGLTHLILSGDFTGEIPPELGNLTSLTYLSLRGDGLTGCIPASLESQFPSALYDSYGFPIAAPTFPPGVTFCTQ